MIRLPVFSTIRLPPMETFGEIAGYKIYRDGRQVAMTEQTTYTDGRLEADREYVYKVYAVDVYNVFSANPQSLYSVFSIPSAISSPFR